MWSFALLEKNGRASSMSVLMKKSAVCISLRLICFVKWSYSLKQFSILIVLPEVLSIFKIGAKRFGYFPCIHFCWSIARFFLALKSQILLHILCHSLKCMTVVVEIQNCWFPLILWGWCGRGYFSAALRLGRSVMLLGSVLPLFWVVIGGLIRVRGDLGSFVAGLDGEGVDNRSWVWLLVKWIVSLLLRTVPTIVESMHGGRWFINSIRRWVINEPFRLYLELSSFLVITMREGSGRLFTSSMSFSNPTSANEILKYSELKRRLWMGRQSLIFLSSPIRSFGTVDCRWSGWGL